MKDNLILELSFRFALKIIRYCDILIQNKKYVISNQLLKSGTSIGANVREAQNPHSKADFVSKLIIAMKEAEETEYWLLLCQQSEGYPPPDNLMYEITSIKKILGKIIANCRKQYPL